MEEKTKICGIEFAPLSIPLERRLQTLAAFHYTGCFLCFGFGMLFFFIYLLFTSYYFIPFAYMAWYLHDRKISIQGGRRSDWVRRWSLFRYAANYFPVKLVKTTELHPAKNYIFACHPHGVMSQSHFVNFATEGTGFSNVFPGLKSYLCVLSGQFQFPVFRDYFLLSGAIEASRSSIEWVLTREGTGNAVALIIGGAVEALEAHPDGFNLKIQSRKGFCTLALKHGASIVPVYAFGENDLYDQVPNPVGSKLRKFQDFMTNHLGFSPPFFHGRGIFNYNFGLMPYRRPVNTVVGSPIDVDRVEDPSREEVDALHKKYIAALTGLFEEHKGKYGVKDTDHLHLL